MRSADRAVGRLLQHLRGSGVKEESKGRNGNVQKNQGEEKKIKIK